MSENVQNTIQYSDILVNMKMGEFLIYTSSYIYFKNSPFCGALVLVFSYCFCKDKVLSGLYK